MWASAKPTKSTTHLPAGFRLAHPPQKLFGNVHQKGLADRYRFRGSDCAESLTEREAEPQSVTKSSMANSTDPRDMFAPIDQASTLRARPAASSRNFLVRQARVEQVQADSPRHRHPSLIQQCIRGTASQPLQNRMKNSSLPGIPVARGRPHRD
jgi:hypothetical protein